MENKRIKLWKLILIVIILILVAFMIITARKIMIFDDIQNKISKYERCTNIYSKTDSEKSTIEKFIMDDSDKTIIRYKDKPMTVIQIRIGNEKKNYVFFENTKKVTISDGDNSGLLQVSAIENFVNTKSFFEKLSKSISSKVYIDKINEKEYYVIDSKNNENYLMLQNVVSIKVYIDKSTGLPFKLVEITKENDNISKEHIVNYEYDFNTVIDSTFNEPDISGYEIN